ncbi:MAG TPA: glycosyltransferase 87 family protein [Ktedonobacterales bacterium]|nr:glycosyltransferase 87 family protein [Ktedonobacterales bacterium]
MRVDEAAGAVGETEREDVPASRVRLPPLWLLGALAALLLMVAARQDIGDVFEYHCYALDFWQGAHAANSALATPCSVKVQDLAAAPFQELPREYGPLSLVVFSLPMLAPISWYDPVFHALMTAVILGVTWLLDRFGPRGAGHAWLLYTLLGVMVEAAGRFDALVAAAMLIALLAAQRGRSLIAYGSLAVGVLLKFFPLALLPLFLIDSWRRRREQPFWRGPALFVGIVAAGEGVAALINPARALQPLGFMGARCVEAEAYPATLAYLWANVTGAGDQVTSRVVEKYSSLCQFGPGSDAAQTVATLAAVVGLAAVYWLYWRERLSLAQGLLFATGLLIVGVKVFSVQYLLWLSPFVAYIYGMEGMALLGWGAVLLATTLYYPLAIAPRVVQIFGTWLVDHTSALVALRNTLMLIVGGLAWRGALRGSRREAEPTAAPVAVEAGRRP